jgi:hypothetical protein
MLLQAGNLFKEAYFVAAIRSAAKLLDNALFNLLFSYLHLTVAETN